MVTIQKRNKTLRVSRGAYNELYKLTGWKLVPSKGAKKADKGSPETDPGKHAPDPENGSKEPSAPPEGHPDPVGEPGMPGNVDGENLDETLANMSDMELKQYAGLLKINTRNISNREKLIELIKEKQAQE